jgi:hypothetical protein
LFFIYSFFLSIESTVDFAAKCIIKEGLIKFMILFVFLIFIFLRVLQSHSFAHHEMHSHKYNTILLLPITLSCPLLRHYCECCLIVDIPLSPMLLLPITLSCLAHR